MEEVDMHKWFEITKLNICRRGTRTVGEGKVSSAAYTELTSNYRGD